MQQVGRRAGAAPNMYAAQQQQAANSPVMVNISAAQLASAANAPNNCDRKELGLEGAQGVKYIPLSWEDILGKTGMDVSTDKCQQNFQTFSEIFDFLGDAC